MGHRGVVDRKELDDALPGRHGPVHQFLYIVELTYAETVFRAEREHRDGHAGTPPGAGKKLRVDVGHHHVAASCGNFTEEMVRALFPDKGTAGFRVHDDELVFEGLLHVQGDAPVREAAVIQQMELLPVAERAAARDGDGLAGPYLRHGDAEGDISLPRGRRTRIPEGNPVRTAEDDVAERGGVERGISRPFVPPVADHELLGPLRRIEAVRPPLPADHLPSLLHLERIHVSVLEIPSRQLLLPHIRISRIHRIPSLSDAEHEALSPMGMILKCDSNIHVGHLFSVGPDYRPA